MDEKLLIEKSKAGDKEAFAEIYDMYKDQLYRYAYYRLGNHSDAEEAVSECVIGAFRQIRNLRETDAFRSWLFRILSVCCANQIKEQIRQRETEDIDDVRIAHARGQSVPLHSEGKDPSESVTEALDLKSALSQLSSEDREIVLLTEVAGFNSREIAELMKMKDTTVRSRLSRSLTKLRHMLEA